MSEQTDWVDEIPPRQRRDGMRAAHQGRIEIVRIVTEAGDAGIDTDALLTALCSSGPKFHHESAKALMWRAKKNGLIFGKGDYRGKRCLTFRYFGTAERRDAFAFPTPETADEQKARRAMVKAAYNRSRVAALLASETAEEREARLQAKRDKSRAEMWAKRGYAEPPPKKPRAAAPRVKLTAEELAERERIRGRERWRRQQAERIAARLAAGEPVRKSPKPHVKRPARPGRELVAVVHSVDAPVRVAKRPVLVGEAIVTSATRMTVARVQEDYRFWVDPATVRPVFGAMRPGEYLEVDALTDRA